MQRGRQSNYMAFDDCDDIQKVLDLVHSGKYKGFPQQRQILESITRISGKRFFFDSVCRENLFRRKALWSSLVSIVSWRAFESCYYSFFDYVWDEVRRDSAAFDARTISIMLNTLGKSHLPMRSLAIKDLAQKIHPGLQMSATELTNSLNALSKSNDLNHPVIKSAIICLAQMIYPRPDFNAQYVSNSLNALCKTNDLNQPDIKAALISLSQMIQPRLDMDSQSVSVSLNAFSKLCDQISHPDINAAILCLAHMINPGLQMGGQSVANSLNALSKMTHLKESEIEGAIICLAQMIHERLQMNGQEVSNSLNALSKMRNQSRPEIKSAMIHLAHMINPRLQMGGQEISNALNALSKMTDLHEPAIESAMHCLAQKIHPRIEMNGQNISNSLNGLSKLNDLDYPPVKAAIICLARMIHPRLELNGQEVSNSLNGLSKVKYLNQPDIKSAIICLSQKIHPGLEMNALNVANSLTALSKLDNFNDPAIKATAIILSQKIHPRLEMQGQQVSNILSSIGLFNIKDDALILQLLKRTMDLDWQDGNFGACLIFSHNLWDIYDSDLKKGLVSKLSQISKGFSPFLDSNLLYALMGLTMIPSMAGAAVSGLQRLLDGDAKIPRQSEEEFDRLYRFVMWFEKQDLIPRDTKLDFAAIKTKAEERIRPSKESKFQNHVRDCLEELEPGLWKSEVMCPETLYSLDLVKGRTVIEVDGPFHFVWGDMVNFATMIKREILEMYGWRVISIPYYEWYPLKTQPERLEYISNILSKLQ